MISLETQKFKILLFYIKVCHATRLTLFTVFVSLLRETQEDLSFVTVNLRALYLGASAAPMLTTLASTPRSETTSDGSTGSPRTAKETLL